MGLKTETRYVGIYGAGWRGRGAFRTWDETWRTGKHVRVDIWSGRRIRVNDGV